MELYSERQREIAMQDLQHTATQLQEATTIIARFISQTQQHIDQTLVQCEILQAQVQEFATEIDDSIDTSHAE